MYLIIKIFAIFILSQLKYVECLENMFSPLSLLIRNVLNLISRWNPSDV